MLVNGEIGPVDHTCIMIGTGSDWSLMPESHAKAIANHIRNGFDRHYSLFRQITQGALERFEKAEWAAVQDASRERIRYYDTRVGETIAALRNRFPDLSDLDAELWQQVKQYYRRLMLQHKQPELAETFYNSVFCHMFARQYFNNDNIFVESFADEILEVREGAVYASYYPQLDGLHQTLTQIMSSFGLTHPYENLDRDIKRLIRTFVKQCGRQIDREESMRVDLLKPLFFRNKAAYIIGRVVTRSLKQPFVIPLLNSAEGRIYVDTLLLNSNDINIIFGFSRAYFMVDTEHPFALIRFLNQLMPHKASSELYTAIGLQKHGKTVFYRDLLHHLDAGHDQFVIAPGIRGMVMTVFTLPSFPYVFKVIKDKFAPTKAISKLGVKEKYMQVKLHDRAGRMADTLEYTGVALPRDRVSAELLDELQTHAASELVFENSHVVIKHLYIERRMIPLNLYLQQATDEELAHAVNEYGLAIKQIAATNIFPGDMLFKNFGVTRTRRVIFYDYDEICYLHECNFRRIPEPQTPEQEMAAEPWYSVGAHDIFPEELETFVLKDPKVKEAFLRYHRDLLSVDYWQAQQQRIAAGIYEDVYPYAPYKRFAR